MSGFGMPELIIVSAILGIMAFVIIIKKSGKTLSSKLMGLRGMKNFGVFLLAIGGIWALIAFNMNTSVSTPSQNIGSIYIPSTTVNNIGLMDERRNHLIMASLAIVVGVVLFVFGNREPSVAAVDTKKCPYCAESIKIEAIICRFCKKELLPAGSVAVEDINTTIINSDKFPIIESDLLTCPHCDAKYRPNDYRADVEVWYCSSCKNPLPKRRVLFLCLLSLLFLIKGT